jgi:autophagy-related protein 16
MAAYPEEGMAAIRRVMRSMKKRDRVEVDAHRPAIEALTRPFAAQVIKYQSF